MASASSASDEASCAGSVDTTLLVGLLVRDLAVAHGEDVHAGGAGGRAIRLRPPHRPAVAAAIAVGEQLVGFGVAVGGGGEHRRKCRPPRLMSLVASAVDVLAEVLVDGVAGHVGQDRVQVVPS